MVTLLGNGAHLFKVKNVLLNKLGKLRISQDVASMEEG